MSKDILHQKEFVNKVAKLGSALINYKLTTDRQKSNYAEVSRLKEQVLNDGQLLGFSDNIIIQMVYDATKNQLTEWYVRKLFSGDFNRKMLHSNPVNSHNESNKVTEESTSLVRLPIQTSDGRNSSKSMPSYRFPSIEEVETIELDLKQALENGLKEHLDKCEKNRSVSYIVKIFVKDGLLRKIEKEFT